MRRTFLAVFLVSVALVTVSLGVLFVQGCGGDGTPTASRDVAGPAQTPTIEPSPSESSPAATPGIFAPTGMATGPAEHDGQRALAILQDLAKEPRVSGSAAEVRAAESIADRFRSYGYTTEIMDFQFDGDRFRVGEVTVGAKTVSSLTLAGSSGGKVEAEAVYVGLADEAGVAGKALNGKVAVADRGTLNFIDKYRNVKNAGASGLIIVNNKPGPFSGNLTTSADIPVVALSQEDGTAALNAAKSGEKVTVDSPPTVGPTKALNVIARASAGGACTVLVGAHFDSVPGAPGANDNASGTASVIELARAMAADGPDEGLCFATFGAEESGLYGSKALAARMKDEGNLPKFMLNLDVTGIGDDVEVIGTGEPADDALQAAKGLDIPAVSAQLPPNSGSDHQSFIDVGVPTVFLTSGDFATIHSPQDVAQDISATMLDQIGDTSLALIKAWLVQVARG